MHPGTPGPGTLSLLNWSRVGRKASDVFTALLAVIRLNGQRTDMRESTPGDVYREVAFRHLLESETRRSTRSGHTCRILLVYCSNAQGVIVPMGRHLSTVVIDTLSGNLRSTDCIGWYRDEHIVGALLATMRGNSVEDGHNGLQLRLQESLRARLSPEETSSVQIRVCRHDEVAQI
ncbi:MAG: hypothetical protein LZF62_340217 [Nitrospira sp.]|nr:MAG: hypothetical protein LZF62_340217 [Nitrospira sp.]